MGSALAETTGFRQIAMPFGASAAALAFDWVASALFLLMSSVLAIGATNFYDDFIVLEVESFIASACQTIQHARVEPQGAFAVRAGPLVALVDLSDAEFRTVRVGNRSSLAEEVSEMIDCFVVSYMNSRRLLEKLHGRILFARSLCFGRFAGCALRTLNFVTSVRKASDADDEELREVLSLLSRAIWGSTRSISEIQYPSATEGAFDE